MSKREASRHIFFQIDFILRFFLLSLPTEKFARAMEKMRCPRQFIHNYIIRFKKKKRSFSVRREKMCNVKKSIR